MFIYVFFYQLVRLYKIKPLKKYLHIIIACNLIYYIISQIKSILIVQSNSCVLQQLFSNNQLQLAQFVRYQYIIILIFAQIMEPQSTVSKNSQKQKLIAELNQFGFLQEHILKAIQYTNNKETAAEIIIKIMEEGPQADLSIYKQHEIVNQIQPESKSSQYNKPIKPKMIFLINGQLKMGKGKICAQVAHAVIGAYLQIQQESKFNQLSANRLKAWENSGSPKIVVKCPSQKQMLEIEKKLKSLKIGINTYLVEDAGHTQIKAGSKTILAVGPAFSDQIDPFTQHLKLA